MAMTLFDKYGPAVVVAVDEWRKSSGYEVKDHMGHTLIITAYKMEIRLESWPQTVCIKLTEPAALKRERSFMRVEPRSSERVVEVVNEYMEMARLENAKLTPERMRWYSSEWRDLIERMNSRGVSVLLGYYGPDILSFEVNKYSVHAKLKNASWHVTSSQGAAALDLDDRSAITRIDGLMLIAPFFRTQEAFSELRSAISDSLSTLRDGLAEVAAGSGGTASRE